MRSVALPVLVALAACAAPPAQAAPPAPAGTRPPAAIPMGAGATPTAAPQAPAAAPQAPAAAPGVPSAPVDLAGAARGCVDDGAPYDAAALRARVARLASAELDGRAAGSPGDAAARAYLVERFRCLGLVPAGAHGSYEQPFITASTEGTENAEGHATANLIGYLPGDDAVVGGDIIVVGAHHDHLGDRHLGANDNASGVAALLAIAQAVRQHGTPHRTIAFLAFGGEELGLLGSTYFAAHPPAALPLERIVYDINLDMIGSYRSAGAVYAMGTFRGLPATAIVKALQAERPALKVGVGGRGVGSDHEAFCEAGVPYVFFWTPDKRCYHARCDTVEQLDAAHAGEIAAFAGDLVERLARSPGDLAASRTRLGCTGHATR